jgi:DNA-binding FadR family transcriptional regulator
MKAMFANLTTADFGGLSKQERRAAGRSKNERRAAERRRVYALFEEIQIAIHHGDRARVDDLMTELAIATGKRWRGDRSAETQPIDE